MTGKFTFSCRRCGNCGSYDDVAANEVLACEQCDGGARALFSIDPQLFQRWRDEIASLPPPKYTHEDHLELARTIDQLLTQRKSD